MACARFLTRALCGPAKFNLIQLHIYNDSK